MNPLLPRSQQRLWFSLRKILRDSTIYSYQFSRIFSPAGALTLIGLHLFAAYYDSTVGFTNFNTLPFRLGICIVITAFLFRDHIPGYSPRHATKLWTVFLTILIPYCYGTILIFDAAYAAPGTEINLLVVIQYILAMFFLVQLAFNPVYIFYIWLIGTTAAALQVLFLPFPNINLVLDSAVRAMPFFLTTLAFGAFINRQLFNLQYEKEAAVWNVANTIAHQLRTPLISIRNFAHGADKKLNPQSNQQTRVDQEFSQSTSFLKSNVAIVRDSLADIQQEVAHSNSLIDILITNSRPLANYMPESTPISISQTVVAAIDNYPYNNPKERKMIHFVAGDDFYVVGIEKLVRHIIFNLIGNAVDFCQKVPAACVEISLCNKANVNQVTVRDNGPGIPNLILHRIFEPFFSVGKMNGTGIGLPFCRSAMKLMGGSIECESVQGSYCEFVLSFPKINSPKNPQRVLS